MVSTWLIFRGMQGKKKILSSLFAFCLFFVFLSTYSSDYQLSDQKWMAGIARIVITPSEPLWLAGYASRDHVSSQMVYGLPSKWAPGIQDKIINEFRRLAPAAGIIESVP